MVGEILHLHKEVKGMKKRHVGAKLAAVIITPRLVVPRISHTCRRRISTMWFARHLPKICSKLLYAIFDNEFCDYDSFIGDSLNGSFDCYGS